MPDGPTIAEDRRPLPLGGLLLELLGAFGMLACLTVFFFGMRGIMDLGGFVAKGGPYEIAHPAPDWVWVIPVSIMVGLLSGAIQVTGAQMAGGFSLAFLGWSGTFLAGAWNFFEYGFRPPGGGGLAWGWIVSGVAFLALGLPGLVGFAAEVSIKGALPFGLGTMFGMLMKTPPALTGSSRAVYAAANVVAVTIGVVAGWQLFAAVS